MSSHRHAELRFCVERDVLDDPMLEDVACRQASPGGPSLKEKLKDSMRCSAARLKSFLFAWFPVLSWLPWYPLRENALGDVISGVSVGIMHLPQGMAYALLSTVPPVFGLYTSFYPVLVYFIFGTSRHISVGSFAVIGIMTGGVTEKLAPDDLFLINGTNGSLVVDTEARERYRIGVVAATTLLCGLFQVALGLLRFGFVVTYLCEPLVRGYTTAAAMHVVISQLKYTLGLSPKRYRGPLSQLYVLVNICELLPESHAPTLLVSLVSLAVLIVVKEFNSNYRHKLLLPIPIELLVIIGGTVVSHFAHLPETHAVDVVGEIPSGLVPPCVPDISFFSEVFGEAFAMAVVGYAINISLGKTFALKHGYKVDSNQELVAVGLSNAVGGFFRCYPVTSSLSRSLVQESTGGKTQVAGAVSAVIVLITMLKLGSLFENLPKAVLSAIVYANLKGMFKQYEDIPLLWKTNKVDLLVWVVTFLCTLMLNLDMGLAASIAFTLLTVIFRTQLPKYSVLGWLPGTELYLETDLYKKAKEIPGITIFRSSSMLYYANAELFKEALQEKCGISVSKSPVLKRKQPQKQNPALNASACDVSDDGSVHCHGSDQHQHQHMNGGVTFINGEINLGFLSEEDINSGVTDTHVTEDRDTEPNDVGSEQNYIEQDRTCAVILDFSTVSFIDTVTLKTLTNIFKDFAEVDVTVYIAGCQVFVLQQLEHGGFFSASVPKSHLFPSIHDAVLHCLKHRGRNLHHYQTALEMPCDSKL